MEDAGKYDYKIEFVGLFVLDEDFLLGEEKTITLPHTGEEVESKYIKTSKGSFETLIPWVTPEIFCKKQKGLYIFLIRRARITTSTLAKVPKGRMATPKRMNFRKIPNDF